MTDDALIEQSPDAAPACGGRRGKIVAGRFAFGRVAFRSVRCVRLQYADHVRRHAQLKRGYGGTDNEGAFTHSQDEFRAPAWLSVVRLAGRQSNYGLVMEKFDAA